LGGVPYPELSDWHPKGAVSKSYDLWNEERGASIRAVVIIDKAGTIRFRETYQPGTLPDPQTVLQAVAALG
jgi:peroxiredoxin (alkyl hydroperoxide reductase subunit C)